MLLSGDNCIEGNLVLEFTLATAWFEDRGINAEDCETFEWLT